MVGYISVIMRDKEAKTLKGGVVKKALKIKINIVDKFTFKGHQFIIHKPHNKPEATGFVCSHATLGYLASEPPKQSKGRVSGVSTVKDPFEYKTIEEAKEATISNINNYISKGNDFDAHIRNFLPTLVRPVEFIHLKLFKIV